MAEILVLDGKYNLNRVKVLKDEFIPISNLLGILRLLDAVHLEKGDLRRLSFDFHVI